MKHLGRTEATEGRVDKRRRATRARLLEAAYEVMCEVGVDSAKIKDITDRADIGFGTFYLYFPTKDDLARDVLDCVINDLGRRCDLATRQLRSKDIALVMPVSMRLVMQYWMRAPLWRWWALRPDLLVDRVRDGFRPFAVRDICAAAKAGVFDVDTDKIDQIWSLVVWMLVGALHDVVVTDRSSLIATQVVTSAMRMMGVPPREAERISGSALPKFPPPSIDWNYKLVASRRTNVT